MPGEWQAIPSFDATVEGNAAQLSGLTADTAYDVQMSTDSGFARRDTTAQVFRTADALSRKLAAVNVNGTDIMADFDRNTLAYTLTSLTLSTDVTVTASAESTNAVVTVDPALTEGARNADRIVVVIRVAEGGTTRAYTLTITVSAPVLGDFPLGVGFIGEDGAGAARKVWAQPFTSGDPERGDIVGYNAQTYAELDPLEVTRLSGVPDVIGIGDGHVWYLSGSTGICFALGGGRAATRDLTMNLSFLNSPGGVHGGSLYSVQFSTGNRWEVGRWSTAENQRARAQRIFINRPSWARGIFNRPLACAIDPDWLYLLMSNTNQTVHYVLRASHTGTITDAGWFIQRNGRFRNLGIVDNAVHMVPTSGNSTFAYRRSDGSYIGVSG